MKHAVVAAAVAAAVLVAAAAPADVHASPQRAAHAHALAPVAGAVTRTFDPPRTRYGAGHRGVDLRAAPGTPVGAAMGGTVTFSGAVATVGWVTVDHGGGLRTTYGPLDPRTAAAGEIVARGELLGFVARGAAHLDWGARLDDGYIDPLSLLGLWETYLTTDEDSGLPALGGTVSSAAPATGKLRWPLRSEVTSSFGPRVHPITGEHRRHDGIDIGAPTGTKVRSAAGGTVAFAGPVGGYGNTVVVEHGGGRATLYAHLSRIDVPPGATVVTGTPIGEVGATGSATGPHLHFEVRDGGVARDPLPLLTG